MACNLAWRSVQLTQRRTECYDDSRTCCSVSLYGLEDREKVRERIYFPVCRPLTHRLGTVSNQSRLRVMSRENSCAKTLPLSAGRHGTTDASYNQKKKKKKLIMNKGKVKFFNTNKGFGFITQNQGEDIFFHVSELQGSTASEGDKVEYEIAEGRKGLCAVNIREARNF